MANAFDLKKSPTVKAADLQSPGTLNGRQGATIIQASALGTQIDDLLELRSLIKKSQDAERKLTAQVMGTLQRAGLTQFDGQEGVAILGERINLVPDVQLFVETLGAKAFQAMTVKVEAARELLGEQDLQAISESTATPVLRVVPCPARPPDGRGPPAGRASRDFEALSWAGSKVDAWIYRTDSRVAPLVVGLGIWGSLLVGGIAAFVLAIRWLP